MPKKRDLKNLQSDLLSDALPSKEEREQIAIEQGGTAGKTGEIYFSVVAMYGRKAKPVTDPRDGSRPVFTKRHMAEQVCADLEKLRKEGEFKDQSSEGQKLSKFAVIKYETGTPSDIIRPNAGEIGKYGR